MMAPLNLYKFGAPLNEKPKLVKVLGHLKRNPLTGLYPKIPVGSSIVEDLIGNKYIVMDI